MVDLPNGAFAIVEYTYYFMFITIFTLREKCVRVNI